MRNLMLLALLSAPVAAGPKDIAETAIAAGQFKTLVAALQATDLVGALKGKGPFTVFAPVDAAFAAVGKKTLDGLLAEKGRATLKSILLFHVVPSRLTARDLVGRDSATSLQGGAIDLRFADGRLTVAGAGLLKTDIECSNGVIHVIDKVILPPAPARAAATARLFDLAIERGVPVYNAGQKDACAAIYEIAVRAAVEFDGELTDAERARLERALATKDGGTRDRAWQLRYAMDDVLASLEKRAKPAKTSKFKVTSEAPLPEGFPKPGPVGEVVVKSYPRYRAARVAGGMSAFGSLFSHIKRNDIAMTAPVEMGMAADGDTFSMTDMAFLYASPDLGRTGQAGNVEVLDLEPRRVASFGMRGPVTPAKLADAKARVEKRVAADGLARDGDWRLMGYNSPMIPEQQRFYELQLPVKASERS